MVLEKLDPYGQVREDYRIAHLIARVAEMVTGKSQKAEDFLLEFRDSSKLEEQSLEQIEAMLKTWVAAANIVHRKEFKAKANN